MLSRCQLAIRKSWQQKTAQFSTFTSAVSAPAGRNAVLHVDPKCTLFDQCVNIRVTGLQRDENITMYSYMKSASGNLFECFAHYMTDNNGNIQLQTQPSIGGMYHGVEPMGLFWAMKSAASNKRKHVRFFPSSSSKPVEVILQAYQGLKNAEDLNTAHIKPLAEVKVERWYKANDVQKIEVNEGDLQGTLCLPPGNGPFPGIISLSGIIHEMDYRPAMLASHGFAAFGVEYIRDTPFFQRLEYFEKAINYLRRHPKVMAEQGVGIWGISKGGSMACAIAAYLDGIRCAVVINASMYTEHTKVTYRDRIWPRHQFELKEFPLNEDGYLTMLPSFLTPKEPLSDENQKMLFEFHKRPDIAYLFIAGLDDKCTPAEFYSYQAERFLKSMNHKNYQIIRYKGAGHILDPPNTPLCSASSTPVINIKGTFAWGGKPYGHNIAQVDSWKQTVNFFKKCLLPTS